MKRAASLTMLLSLAVVFARDTALAESPYGMAGCGLGSIIIKDNGMIQLIPGTTNATLGVDQTFGITSGTSNCVEDGVVTADREQEAFVEANMSTLRRDMATGGGEYLTALGDLLGCGDAVQPSLGGFAQRHYGSVYPSSARTPREVLYTFKAHMSVDAHLSASCARL